MTSAVFTHAVRYTVSAVCKTPLRTGNGDVQTVLRDVDGVPFIQGSSLAGALRSWLEQQESMEHVQHLFGSQEQEGHLMVSDGRFEEQTQMEMRPRLRISPKTGCAERGAKFDVAHVAKDSTFTFTLTWLGTEAELEVVAVVEQMLAALHAGEIRLGAQKNNGFGRVMVSVKKRMFDLYQTADREAWLTDAQDDKPMELPKLAHMSDVKFTVVGRLSHVLVKASAPTREENANIIKNITEQGQAILPASSIKGAVRARVNLIAAQMGVSQSAADDLFGRGASEEDNGKRGKVRFEDIVLSGTKQKISRIRINKFTGGVMRRGLFTEEPHSCDIEMPIWIPQTERAGCALVLYALRDFGLGLYSLGSGGAVGHGTAKLDSILVQAPDGTQAKLCFDAENGCTVQDPAHLFDDWMCALREELT